LTFNLYKNAELHFEAAKNILRKETLTMSNQEAQESGNGGTPESAAEITLNFEPQTEQELIEYAKWLKTREHQSVVKLRWYLGHKIDGSGDSVYGQDTAGRIAEEVGYSKSTVHKSLKFAREYSNDQLASLLNGPFSLSWRDVAQNLSVAPEEFLRTYHDSENLEQFRNAVTQLRPTRNQNPRPPRKTRVELETENAELQNRVSELETENAILQERIKELEGQKETSGANSESIKETESAEELSN
jgi:hypothetical protein